VIRADASTQIGTGHFMRCLALAQAWKDIGSKITFITTCTQESLLQRIRDEGCDLKTIAQNYPAPGDWNCTKDTLATNPNAWLVLDGYHFDEAYQQQVKSAGSRLLVIDDIAHLKHYYADIVLNQNLCAEQMHYSCEPYTHLLLGTRYVLLRREFLAWKDWERKIPKIARRVLVTLGGSDPENHTLKVIEALQNVDIPGLEATAVIGASNPNASTLEYAATQSRIPFRLVHDAKNMPELMAWADVAVSGGGTSAWELLFMEMPTLFLMLANNQQHIVEYIESQELGKNLGQAEDISSTLLTEAITSFAKDLNRRATISQRTRQVVDGQGIHRATRSMQKPETDELKLRPATPEDSRLLWELANDPAVRASSFSTEIIPWEDHLNWLKMKVSEPGHKHYIIIQSDSGSPIGQVRFDSLGDKAEIHVSIASHFHGHGYGSQAISIASKQLLKETEIKRIYANIRPDNISSIRAFANAGFRTDGTVKIVEGHKAVQMVLDKDEGAFESDPF